MKAGIILVLSAVLIFSVIGCGKHAEQNSTEAVSPKVAATKESAAIAGTFKQFVVYTNKGGAENHFIPSGWMGDVADITFDDAWQENPQSGRTCIKVAYSSAASGGNRWAGLYWQSSANNWGKKKSGFDLTGATKLTFWARGEKGGERIEEFKMGGITGDYPDSDASGINGVILTKEWKQYTIDLGGKDLSYVSGGFCWATNLDVNPEGCTFYLDDIIYE